MHVHRNQFDPNLELSTINAAAKAEAKKAAERTRRKLLEAASALAGESDGYVVRLGSREGSQEDARQHDQSDEEQQNGSKGQKPQTNLSQMIRGLFGN
jgi:hypothetical protein